MSFFLWAVWCHTEWRKCAVELQLLHNDRSEFMVQESVCMLLAKTSGGANNI